MGDLTYPFSIHSQAARDLAQLEISNGSAHLAHAGAVERVDAYLPCHVLS
jgi:hypothetical protein